MHVLQNPERDGARVRIVPSRRASKANREVPVELQGRNKLSPGIKVQCWKVTDALVSQRNLELIENKYCKSYERVCR